MKRSLLAFGILISFVLSAQAQSNGFSQLPDGVVQFVTPSAEVGCTYIPFDGANGIPTGQNSSELHCYRLDGPDAAVSLGVKGKARGLIVTGKLDCCAGNNVLAFGKSWTAGGYKCKSERKGLTCTWGRHGFVFSATNIRKY
ncbi:MAG: hypothetical protein ACRCU5_02630 [Rhizobiaceae bacterium]